MTVMNNTTPPTMEFIITNASIPISDFIIIVVWQQVLIQGHGLILFDLIDLVI